MAALEKSLNGKMRCLVSRVEVDRFSAAQITQVRLCFLVKRAGRSTLGQALRVDAMFLAIDE